MSKCKAKNPATCRVHGSGYITDLIVKEFVIQRGFSNSVKDFQNLTKDVIKLIDNWDKPEIALDNPRDAKGIQELLKTLTYSNPNPTEKDYLTTSFKSLNHLPYEAVIEKICWMKDNNSTSLPEVNLLDRNSIGKKDVLGEEVTPYKLDLASYIADKGTPVSINANYYGWADYDMSKHIKGPKCSIVAISSIEEDSWNEFIDTFNEDDDHIYGVRAEAQCACGLFKGQLRVSEKIQDIMYSFLNKKSYGK